MINQDQARTLIAVAVAAFVLSMAAIAGIVTWYVTANPDQTVEGVD